MSFTPFPDVVVNGEIIPYHVVARETQNHSGPKGKPGIAWRKAANAVAMRTLLLQEAKRRGLAGKPIEIAPGRVETLEDALIRELLDSVVEIKPFDEEDIHAEWARDPGRFRAPPLWEVSHILCGCDPRDETAKNTAWLRAGDLARQACASPHEFARLAARHSDCGSKGAGGALGQLGPGDMVPEFEAALRALNDGGITPEPVLARHGWHVIRMDAIAEGSVLPFDAVRMKIVEAMEKAAWARSAKKFVEALVTSSEISGADLGMGNRQNPGDGMV